MKQKALNEKSDRPEDADFKSILGDSYRKYEELLFLVNTFKKKWTYYKGWSLKVFDKKKALFYLFPYFGSFDVIFAIRESEKDILIADDDFKDYRDSLENGKKFPEGIKMHFEIEDDKSYSYLEFFLKGIMELR